jgi:hypothetical protein
MSSMDDENFCSKPTGRKFLTLELTPDKTLAIDHAIMRNLRACRCLRFWTLIGSPYLWFSR